MANDDVFGAAALNRLIQGGISLFAKEELTWWGDMLVAVACSVVVLLIVLRVKSTAKREAQLVAVVTERYAKPEPADTNTEPITNMRTESEIRARVQQLLNIRDEIIQLSGVPEWARSSTVAVAAIDDVISQLNWVLGENG